MDLKELKKVSLSNKDVMALIGNKANLVLYPDVSNYGSLDDLMGPYGASIILYESKPSYGHWVTVFKLNDTNVEYFNSYGDSLDSGFPDATLKHIPKDFREVSNQNHTYLADLMMKSPYQLSYNQFPFQKKGSDIRTCGRHVACRLLFRHLSLDEYYKMIKRYCNQFKMDPDDVVTVMTTK